jgi:hypothetical protein
MTRTRNRRQNETGSKGWRRFGSILLVVHLLAVFSAPWASPPPSSELARAVAEVFRPYQVAAFLNHGYRFFAPNPGPSHLVRYEIDLPDGKTEFGRFPDRSKIWPRLLYHRHFMISETVFNLEAPIRVEPNPQEVSPEGIRAFHAAKELAHSLRRGIARQLLSEHQGTKIRLFLQEHSIPLMEEVRAGQELNNRLSYYDLTSLGEYSADQL